MLPVAASSLAKSRTFSHALRKWQIGLVVLLLLVQWPFTPQEYYRNYVFFLYSAQTVLQYYVTKMDVHVCIFLEKKYYAWLVSFGEKM